MRVCINNRDLSFPEKCACCCGSADTSFSASMNRGSGGQQSWNIPYCEKCISHARLWESNVYIAVGVAAWSIGWFQFSYLAGAFAGTIAMALTVIIHCKIAKQSMGADCSTEGYAVSYAGWYRNVQVFDFTSAAFAAELAQAYARKLVNVDSDLASLIGQQSSYRNYNTGNTVNGGLSGPQSHVFWGGCIFLIPLLVATLWRAGATGKEDATATRTGQLSGTAASDTSTAKWRSVGKVNGSLVVDIDRGGLTDRDTYGKAVTALCRPKHACNVWFFQEGTKLPKSLGTLSIDEERALAAKYTRGVKAEGHYEWNCRIHGLNRDCF